MSKLIGHGTVEHLDWARVAGVLDLRTGEFVELFSSGSADAHIPGARLEALREILVSGAADVVAGLLVSEGREPASGTSSFREALLRDRSGYLFGKLLRNGRLLVVATEPTETPGRIWAQIKVLIPTLYP